MAGAKAEGDGVTTENTVQMVSLSANVPSSLLEALKQIAREHDRTLSAELRRAMREYVEAHEANGEAA